MSLDGSGFTLARAKIGLFATQKRNKIVVGLPGEIREFTARALIGGKRLTEDNTLTSKFALKAIIIGDAYGAPIPFVRNPHSFLIDPCNLETTPDVPMSLALLKMFPTFVTGDETCFTQTAASMIKKHDILKVSLTVGPDGALNLDHGKILSLVQKAPLEDPSSKECLSIQDAFDTPNFVLLGGTQSTDTTGQGDYILNENVCSPVYTAFYLTHPLLSEANLNSPHGMRTRKGKKRMHKGIDLRAKLNTNVYAAADGTVKGLYKDFSSTGGAGNYVKIDHTDGYQTKYFHLIRQPTHIKAGDTVAAGDLIGQSGNTGNTTKPYAPHLHFELWKGSTHIDPMPFIKTIQKCGDTTPPMLAAVDPFTSNTASDEEDLPSNAGEAEG